MKEFPGMRLEERALGFGLWSESEYLDNKASVLGKA
jgi:hypothetical protein